MKLPNIVKAKFSAQTKPAPVPSSTSVAACRPSHRRPRGYLPPSSPPLSPPSSRLRRACGGEPPWLTVMMVGEWVIVSVPPACAMICHEVSSVRHFLLLLLGFRFSSAGRPAHHAAEIAGAPGVAARVGQSPPSVSTARLGAFSSPAFIDG